ncbi:MAG: molybdopterin synthase sulfur carrier subunit [Devosia sp.]|uniref:MoaD/ThiS family protein n=1 Tax=Devosia sp. TaxID=1871048 RepID=UPI00262B0900|nr:MoaD/ThiS family protein [Devosia sp.]MDB5528986.1 molybdopterin synthase sulfur carrier subunit [Devosia sp.]
MKVLYFAWLRERLNMSEEDIAFPPEVVTTGDVIAYLAARDEAGALAFERPAIFKTALDARIVPHGTPLADAKVIALLPPMTGG